MMKKSLFLILAVLLAFGSFAQSAADLILKAAEAVEAKKFAEAFTLYEKAMSNLGDVKVKPAINYDIATTAMQAGNNAAAIKYFDKAIEAGLADDSSGINVAKCYQYKGSVYTKMKDLNSALASFEKAIELTSDNPGSLYLNAAITAFNAGNFEKAVTYFGKSYESGYRPEDALLNKAMAYKKLNNDSAYMEAMLEGNAKFPGNKKFSGTLAGIYITQGQTLYMGGLDILNAANKKVNEKKLKLEDDEYKNEIAKVNESYAKAVEILNKSLELDPGNANAQKLIDACKPVK